jgi:hypothetical protein
LDAHVASRYRSAHPPGDWLGGAAVNLLEEAERSLDRGKLERLRVTALIFHLRKVTHLWSLGFYFILMFDGFDKFDPAAQGFPLNECHARNGAAK